MSGFYGDRPDAEKKHRFFGLGMGPKHSITVCFTATSKDAAKRTYNLAKNTPVPPGISETQFRQLMRSMAEDIAQITKAVAEVRIYDRTSEAINTVVVGGAWQKGSDGYIQQQRAEQQAAHV